MKIWLENYVEGVLNKLITQYGNLLEFVVKDDKKEEFQEVMEILVDHKIQIEKVIKKMI